jgi:hypothetical protein
VSPYLFITIHEYRLREHFCYPCLSHRVKESPVA